MAHYGDTLQEHNVIVFSLAKRQPVASNCAFVGIIFTRIRGVIAHKGQFLFHLYRRLLDLINHGTVMC